MTFAKKTAALVLSGALALSAFGSFASANTTVLTENTAKFQLDVKRTINSSTNQDYKFSLSNLDVVQLNNVVLEFDYNGKLKSNSPSLYTLTRTEKTDAFGAPTFHYVLTFINKWDGQTLGLGKTNTISVKGESIGDGTLDNVLLNSVQRPVKTTSINEWALKATYQVGDVVSYKGNFYKAVQSHRADAPNWYPSLYTSALWSKTKLNVAPAYTVQVK